MDLLKKPLALYDRYHPKKVFRFVMTSKKRQLLALAVVAVLLLGSIAAVMAPDRGDEDSADFDTLLASTSWRSGVIAGGSLVASDDSPFYAVMAAPVACHYEETGEKVSTPLVVAGDSPSLPVKRFLQAYNHDTIVTVGPVGDLSVPVSLKVQADDVKHMSIELAELFWDEADGAMIVDDSKEGYDLAVAAVPLACYLDIPVIVTSTICAGVKSTLDGLGVEYTIAVGDGEGYGKVLRLDDLEEVQDVTTRFIRDPEGLGGDVEYLAIANPDDIVHKEVVETTNVHFEEMMYDHSTRDNVLAATTPPPAATSGDFTIPSDYEYATVHFNLKFRGNIWADEIGSRVYCFVYDDDDRNDNDQPAQEGFFGTPAGRIEGEYRIVDFDLVLNNDTGKHLFSLSAREIWSGSPPGPFGMVQASPEMVFLDIEIQKLASPVYPLMEDLSCLAPYLAAYRQGIVMASVDFSLMKPSYLGCVVCDEPTINPASMAAANVKALEVHNETIHTLARLAGVDHPDLMTDATTLNELADHYYQEPVSVGIVSDTNMVPHYYFPGGMASEGYGEPGDNIYGDVNLDPMNPPMDLGDGRVDVRYPDLELPVGRIGGYDAQDASALLSRTFFYRDIIDNYQGYMQGNVHSEWKNNGYVFLGSEMPVETMYPSLKTQMVADYQEGGFNPKSTSELASHRENSQKFQEGSNFIVGGVHGFYYWYVPSARTKYAGGSAYDVAHVRDMDFGPSTFYITSCVVGRIDGLNPENALAMAYIHGGMNAFVGATRSTYGWIDAGSGDPDVRLDPEGAVLLGEYFSQYVISEDETVGIALRNAKNEYLVEDAEGGIINNIGPGIAYMIYDHYIIHGDPAFNPYEPNHG
jgi:hypothetical protein